MHSTCEQVSGGRGLPPPLNTERGNYSSSLSCTQRSTEGLAARDSSKDGWAPQARSTERQAGPQMQDARHSAHARNPLPPDARPPLARQQPIPPSLASLRRPQARQKPASSLSSLQHGRKAGQPPIRDPLPPGVARSTEGLQVLQAARKAQPPKAKGPCDARSTPPLKVSRPCKQPGRPSRQRRRTPAMLAARRP